MAKRKKMSAPKFTGSVRTAVSTPDQAKRDEEYKVEDNARTVRNYGKLMADRKAHNKALNLIRTENSMVANLASRGKGGGAMQPRSKARQGRRRSVRNLGRA